MYSENIHIISINNLSIGYRNRVLFSNLNFNISEKDIVAIIGLNGSGKSTLIRTICKLQKRIEGEILIKQKNINDYHSDELSKIISVVLAGRGEVLQALTVQEILQIARSPYTGFMHRLQNEDNEIIEQTIEELQLKEFVNKKIYQLSDGEAQKVFIAKTLVQQTPIVFLDEPTSHLDIINKIEIFKLIKQLAKEKNKTIVFASHELELSLQIADKCLLLGKGGEFVFDTTSKLISSGVFENFFASENYMFNKESKKFDIKL
ncbi:MAG: ABC transporter ATP-binding protein [Fimbriimonadaceae bacterium]|nr:ABC transporter ATP-binding protein [Chitinophagales bacterium]